MTGMDQEATSARWDALYRNGIYTEEPPLPFVSRILSVLNASSVRSSAGLYVGCGNGRNYLPLVNSGLRLYGLDLSGESLRQLSAREPAIAAQLIKADFREYGPRQPFGYIVAIQVFQHGFGVDVDKYFAKVSAALSPGGLFFLRVNAASTQIYQPHTIVERNTFGGLTVLYEGGPKRGLPVHFYSRDELLQLTGNDFEVVDQLREDVTQRTPPESGYWVQWEGIWRRRGQSLGQFTGMRRESVPTPQSHISSPP